MKTENKWRDSSLRPFLDSLPHCHYFIKEAGAIRGLPDIVGVWYGVPFYLEVKRAAKELGCPRTKLQEYQLNKFQEAGAFTSFIYPENAKEVLEDLLIAVYYQDEKRLRSDDFEKIKSLIEASF